MELPSRTGQYGFLCQWCLENVFRSDSRTRIFLLQEEHNLLCKTRDRNCDYCLCEGEAEEFSIPSGSRPLTAVSKDADGGCFSCLLIGIFAEHSKRPILFRVRTIWSLFEFPIALHFPGSYFRMSDFEAGDSVISNVISQASRNKPNVHSSGYSLDAAESDPVDSKTIENNFIARCTFIRSQLNNCKSNHPRCRRIRTSTYPSRLLQLSGTPENPILCLIETKHGSQQYLYTCLSYCWGGPQPSETTKANIVAYMQDIRAKTVPQTILDGIKVTLGIDLSYIWVDAYCIIQDSPEDKDREISKMADIYRGAACTLSIPSAASADQGFLQDTMQKPPQHAIIEFDPSQGFIVEVSPELDKQWSKEQIIHTRAWTLQETMLSETIAFLGRAILPVQFRCAEEFRGTYGSLAGRAPDRPPYTRPLAADNNLSLQSEWQHDKWLSIVAEYSTRQMKLRTDKLPAIAAIAAEIQGQGLLGDYLAGLWSEHLILGLLWHPTNTGLRQSAEKEYVGPSWSWVSRAHPVHYQNDLQVDATCKVVNCKTTPISPRNPTGAISSAELTIRCHAVKTSISNHYLRKRHLFFDDDPRPIDLHEVWVLFMAHPKQEFYRSSAGLLVQEIGNGIEAAPADTPTQCRRIGMFRNEVPTSRAAKLFEATNLGLADPKTYPIREFTLV